MQLSTASKASKSAAFCNSLAFCNASVPTHLGRYRRLIRQSQLSLVGVEYIVFKAAWERVNGVGAAPPEILGHPLLASSHIFPGNANPIDHYELHVWVWKDNPNGMFAPYNPNVTC